MRHIIWRNRASAILGLLVMVMPFTGFPEIMRDSLVVLSGFLIALFGFYHSSSNYALIENSIDVNPRSSLEGGDKTEPNPEGTKSKVSHRAKKVHNESSPSD